MKKNIDKSVNELRYSVLAVDAVIFSIIKDKLCVFTINTNITGYYKNTPALPGGVILNSETAEQALKRHLINKTKIKPAYIEQLYTFSEIKRDPRNRVVSISYLCIIPEDKSHSDIGNWKEIKGIGKLAFDHNKILKNGYDRLKSKILYSNIIKYFLPNEFTLQQLKNTYEVILNSSFDKRNFISKIKDLNIVKSTGKKIKGKPNRPAELFKFNDDVIVFKNPFKGK
jgi:8-oxo-dGTP diphosphatase